MSIFPPLESLADRLVSFDEEARARLAEEWAPVIRKCPELEGKSREEIQRFAGICAGVFEEYNHQGDISRFTRVVLPNIRRLFGYELPADTPLLRTIEEENELLHRRPNHRQINEIASGLGRRKLDLDEIVIEPDYQI